MAENVDICDVGGGGLMLPFTPGENERPKGPRAVVYGIVLCWLFLGVMIVSDLFMGAIERITSQKKRKMNPATNRHMTVLVWNPTVANLTLMALGSSAPEILLSVIELFGNSLFAGALGPSTIVGSAAFNLLIILAVCVSAIPNGEVRRIKEMGVYAITASCSLFAYLWLLIILMGISPNVVEWWEGTLTFFFFPILVTLAYLADIGMLPGMKPVTLGREQVIGMSKEELAERKAKLQKDHGGTLSEEQITTMLMVESEQKTYASYRVAGIRKLTGGKPVFVKGLNDNMSKVAHSKVVPFAEADAPEEPETEAIIEFAAMKVAVMESAGTIELTVLRQGASGHRVSVNYMTREGTAKKESDFEHAQGTLVFEPHETEKRITVKIIDDVAFEDDEEFYVDLSDAQAVDSKATAFVGHASSMTVVIIDDDLPGVLGFPQEEISILEQNQDFEANIAICRKDGCSGKVSVNFKTENGTAVAGVDYDAASGKLEFEKGETQKAIKVSIKARGRYNTTDMFRVILTDPTGGAKLDAETDGGADSCILTVQIDIGQDAKKEVDRIMSKLQSNWTKAQVGHANWCDQFKSAMYPLGGEEDDDEEDEEGGPRRATMIEWSVHIVSLPFKLLFALVPPTDYCGGWACFICSLMMIGLVTALVGDVASLFGCCLGWPSEVTAITFVALGTSLPDTFASKASATQDPHADASIGNVTGSNSVNVFLGLGLPWMIGAFYWQVGGPNEKWKDMYLNDPEVPDVFKTGAFVIKAGSLGFSVLIFSICAVICMGTLALRRRFIGAELGGPVKLKYATSAFLVALWLFYIGMSSWYTVTQTPSR